MLAEPLLHGTSWSTTGAAQNDVVEPRTTTSAPSRSPCPRSRSRSLAAKIRSQITQAGALGDPYGSGVRTTWWVYGVGPVKIVVPARRRGGAPVTTAVLQATNQTREAAAAGRAYFPLKAA